MTRLGILLSGRGSNFVAIADALAAGELPGAEIAVVLSNKPDAPGLKTAHERGFATQAVPSKGVPREEHDAAMVAALRGHGVDLICLAGYMRVLTPR